jgi:sulfur carrier protein
MSLAPGIDYQVSVTVNGQPVRLPRATTVTTLLETMDTADKRIAVERNGEIVPRSQHGTTVIEDGDQLEIVIAVGGG